MRDLAAFAFALGASVTGLHGCGSSPSNSTTPSGSDPEPTATPTAGPDFPTQGDWKLRPKVMKGKRFVDSKTDEVFVPMGIGFPNCGDEDGDVGTWIAVLEHLRQLSPEVNTIRLYEPPKCAFESDCFKPFMRKADDLGFYVLVPGTHSGDYGYIPTDPSTFDNDPDQAYQMGGVLGFGQTAVSRFNYPNTLAIVIGNEVDQFAQFHPYMGVLKAYARDLRAFMKVCQDNDESPTKGDMRLIPLMYASSDAEGDNGVFPKADYLFCGDEQGQADIFGLNIERFCDDTTGPQVYQQVNDQVKQKKYPGAFFYSEMGCTKTVEPDNTRSWKQVENFFSNNDAISGYAAYAMYGNEDFNMVSDRTATSTVNADGENFFNALKVGKPAQPPSLINDGEVPQCPAKLYGDSEDIHDWTKIKWYDTGKAGYASACPVPYGSSSVETAYV